jgi:hemolysin III
MTPWRPKEPFNGYSHLLGVLLSIIGLILLVFEASGPPLHMVGFLVYGVSLVLLYCASTGYHWISLSPRGEDLLRRFDHCAIFLLIAGTYTPICLVNLRGDWGWSLFGAIWTFATVGVALKVFFRHLPRWATSAIYLGMGWLAVVAIVPLVREIPLAGLIWLAVGGISYTIGAVIYALQRPDPLPAVVGFHGVFHVLVLIGSAMHFIFMMGYVVPVT